MRIWSGLPREVMASPEPGAFQDRNGHNPKHAGHKPVTGDALWSPGRESTAGGKRSKGSQRCNSFQKLQCQRNTFWFSLFWSFPENAINSGAGFKGGGDYFLIMFCFPKRFLQPKKSVFMGLLWSDWVFWFWLPPATKAPRGRPSPHHGAEENEKKEAETGGSG